jgi:hypothetical protein
LRKYAYIIIIGVFAFIVGYIVIPFLSGTPFESDPVAYSMFILAIFSSTSLVLILLKSRPELFLGLEETSEITAEITSTSDTTVIDTSQKIMSSSMKLVDLAQAAMSVLEEAGDDGVRSEVLAEVLGVPKRRIYDVVAILKALDRVTVERRFDGITVRWVPQSTSDKDKRELQIQLVEAKEQLRKIKSELRRSGEMPPDSTTRFDTKVLIIRTKGEEGFKKVVDSGKEVVVEGFTSGFIVTTDDEYDEDIVLKSIQKI